MQIEKAKVLVVDDDHTVRAAFHKLLESLGVAQIVEGQNGQEAIALFRQEKPDVALLDINMPLLEGDEALKQIRKEFPEAKVIMMTSVADAEVVKRCVLLGASHYILKNNSLDKISVMLQDLFARL